MAEFKLIPVECPIFFEALITGLDLTPRVAARQEFVSLNRGNARVSGGEISHCKVLMRGISDPGKCPVYDLEYFRVARAM